MLDRRVSQGEGLKMPLIVREDVVKDITGKLWDFIEKELSGKGYTHQELLIAWDSVMFAQTIKSAKKYPENIELRKFIKELLE